MTMLWLGLGLLAMGGVIAFQRREDFRRFQRLRAGRAATTQTATAGLVELQGTIVAGPLGTVRAPLSGREAVWFRVVVEETRGDSDSEETVTLVDESDSREFLLDDGHGRARVEPASAHVVVDRETIGASGLFRDPTPALDQFLASRGHESTTRLGFNRRIAYREERLHLGDGLLATGEARRLPRALPADGSYRKAATELVLATSVDGREELLLTTKSRGVLAYRLLAPPIGGLVLCLVGLVLMVLGLR